MSNSLENQELIEELVTSIGDEVLAADIISTPTDEIEVYFCLHGNQEYRIIEEVNRPSFLIKFVFNLVDSIGRSLSDERIHELTGEKPSDSGQFTSGEDLEEDEEDVETKIMLFEGEDELPPADQAGLEILKAVDKETMERFRFNLFQELSDPMVASVINDSDEVPFKGFEISRRFFPEDDGFSLTEFNNSVQAVVSQGLFGKNTVSSLLVPEIDLDSIPDEEEEDDNIYL